MKVAIMANGEYGQLGFYQSVIEKADLILCADGGANYAYAMNIKPAVIIGDMDSIKPEVREFFLTNEVKIQKYPRKKDFTDTQLALDLAEEQGADEVIFLGTLGKRLDHTMSNIYSGIEYVKRGIKIVHYSPECTIYLIADKLEINGQPGDLVSVMALNDTAKGVTELGFEYPLDSVVLEKSNPYAISNVVSADKAEIIVKEGVLAVFHYRQLP